MKKGSFYRGVHFTLLSSFGMSLVGLFGKLGIGEFTIAGLMFWRYVVSTAILGSALFFLGRLKGFFRFTHFPLQLVRTVFVLLAQYCFFYYMLKGSLLNASALLNTGPVFVAILDWALLRKKVGISTWIGALVSFVGALCILQPDAGIISFVSLIGLLSGVSQGASQVVFGVQSEQEERPDLGVLHLFSLCTLFSGIAFVFSPITMRGENLFGWWDLSLILGIGVCSIINQLFRAEAYSHDSPSRLSPYLYFAVLLAGVWDWAIFGQQPNWLSILGAGLIVLGGVLKIILRHWIRSRGL